MSQLNLQGTYTALVTPFVDEAGLKPKGDLDSYKSLVEWQIESGVEGLVVLGSTGEAATLDAEEKIELVKLTIELVAGRLPVIVGTTSNCTYRALEDTQTMAKLGADAALIATPPYNRPTQRGLLEHFGVLAKEGGLPIVLYDIPGRTCSAFEPETIEELSAYDSIIALKDATGNIEKAQKVIPRVGQQIALFSGDDQLASEFISIGAKGLISASASAFPVEMKAIVDAALSGDLDTAKVIQEKTNPTINAMFIETNPSPVKEALKLKGIIKSSRVRLPLVELEDSSKAKIKSILA